MRLSALVSVLATCALAQNDDSKKGGSGKDKPGLDPGQLDCPKPGGAHIIATSGHGGFPHDYGLLIGLLNGIKKNIPGSNNYSIPYLKKDPDRAEGVAEGVALLRRNIAEYVEACPKVPIVLIGYSEGAIVNSNTLCGRSHEGSPWSPGIPAAYNKRIIAAALYGDETFISGQPQDRGTCKQGQGVNPRQNPAGCKPFQPMMRQWCDMPDPECCGGHKNHSHFQYPDKYDDQAIQFVTNKYLDYIESIGGTAPGSGGSGGGGSGGSGGGSGGSGGKKPKKGKKKPKKGLLGGILGGLGNGGRGGGGGGGGGH